MLENGDIKKLLRGENKRQRKRRNNQPVFRLSSTLVKIKSSHVTKECDLKKTMAKVELDKHILMQEKLKAIWEDNLFKPNNKSEDLHFELKKQQKTRRGANHTQREAYGKCLAYIGARGVIPLAEEKQLLDGLKLVLDNGWTISTDELIQLFELLGLKKKVFVNENNLGFLEFVYFIAVVFKVDMKVIEDYF